MTDDMTGTTPTDTDMVDRDLDRAGSLIEAARQHLAAGDDRAGQVDIDDAICVLDECSRALDPAGERLDGLSLDDLDRIDGQLAEAERLLNCARQHADAGDDETAERELDRANQLLADVDRALPEEGESDRAALES